MQIQERRHARSAQMTSLPDLVLIDGGKGQLGMACAELKKLGLEKIPVIGLAKEFRGDLFGRAKASRCGSA